MPGTIPFGTVGRRRSTFVALVAATLVIAPAASAAAAPPSVSTTRPVIASVSMSAASAGPTSTAAARPASAAASESTSASAAPIRMVAVADDLANLRVAAPSTAPYDRDDFEHWIDADGDGCNTRSEVLQEESFVTVDFSNGCTVGTGEWFSYYDGLTWTAASDVDIDHFVPLAEAWRSGADDWTASDRREFANDLGAPETLIAVTDNENQSKSDQDPAQWLPPETSVHCQYASEWVSVKTRWDLAVDTAELAALEELVAGC